MHSNDIGPDIIYDVGPYIMYDVGPDIVSDVGSDIIYDVWPYIVYDDLPGWFGGSGCQQKSIATKDSEGQGRTK